MTAHIVVDCRGMQCPAPILEIAKTARRLASQPAWLEIWADDDDFPTDLEAWCRSAQADLKGIARTDNYHRALVGVNGATDAPTSAASSTSTQAPASGGGTSSGRVLDLGAARAASHQRATPVSAHRLPDPVPAVPVPAVPVPAVPVPAVPVPAVPVPAVPVPAAVEAPAEAPVGSSASPEPASVSSSTTATSLDLKGLRAPHPIMRLSQVLLQQPGAKLLVRGDDPGFMTDLVVWAQSARVQVLTVEQRSDGTVARLQLPSGEQTPGSQTVDMASADLVGRGPGPVAAPAVPFSPAPAAALDPTPVPAVAPAANRCTLLILRNDFESLLAAMLTANAARAQNMEVVIYFSFWGVNLLRADQVRSDLPSEPVSFLQRLMKWMMPKGPRRQKMSKMHMGGVGRGMMESLMRRNNVMSLAELLDQAVQTDVRFMVCTMSMGIMGIQKRDLMNLPNIEFGGVTAFVEASRDSRMSMVF